MDKHNRVEDIQKPTHKDKSFKDNASSHKTVASQYAPLEGNASAHKTVASQYAPLEDNAPAHITAASQHAPLEDSVPVHSKIAVKNEPVFNKRKIGAWAEQQACEYLTSNGYKIIKQNFRVSRFGEIDIIAYDAEYICFIEVKARSSCSFGLPREAVTYEKQQKIKMLANIYLSQNRCKNCCVRFDVIEIYYNSLHEIQNLQLLKNAF